MTQLISFVIPVKSDLRVFNMIDRIKHCSVDQDYEYEIIVSGDMKADIPGAKFLCHDGAQKGRNVFLGVRASRGAIIFVCDADTLIDKNIINSMKKALYIHDVVLGSRRGAASNCLRQPPFMRRAVSLALRTILRIFFETSGLDVQFGLKAYRRSAAMQVFQQQRVIGFAFDVEAFVRAQILGLAIFEMPVPWAFGSGSTISLFRDSLAVGLDLLRIRTHYRKGLLRETIQPKGYWSEHSSIPEKPIR